MLRPELGNVVSHWNKLVENFETSPKEFYAAVEVALQRRSIPRLTVSRVTWSESGILSRDREYLRVAGEHHCFDMCAAPYGTGFFFSSWMTKQRSRRIPIYLLLFILAALFTGWTIQFIAQNLVWPDQGGFGIGAGLFFLFTRLFLNPFVLFPLSSLLLLWAIALMARSGQRDAEEAILQVPLLGWIYIKLFSPETYYRIDTMMMFQSAVHAAMMEAIDGQTASKGLRGLSEDERKPIFRELM